MQYIKFRYNLLYLKSYLIFLIYLLILLDGVIMSAKLKACPACGKEVAKSAKVCPNCGKKLKMGWFLKLVILIVALGVLGTIFAPTPEEKAQQMQDTINKLASAPVSKLEPVGELGELFNMGSKNTDIQREEVEKLITGQVVEWTLRVYEVSKDGDYYKVQTQNEIMSNPKIVSAYVYIYPRDENELAKIKSLKTDDKITFKGIITGVSLSRSINIKPAIFE